MTLHTALSDGFDRLYHWQRFDEDRLRQSLRDRTIYCSAPASFNDPWDCKPHFNSAILQDPEENEKHVQWAIAITRRHIQGITEARIESIAARLRADPAFHAAQIEEMSRQLAGGISSRYRVYCLGPDVHNLLMWAHYADNHRGVCLEYATRDAVMCSALRVEYLTMFPLVRAYSQDLEDNLRILLTKSDVWQYEREYRLIAQERDNSTSHPTLFTDKNLLQLPDTTLLSVIVGCQCEFDAVRTIVTDVAPQVIVKRAIRVPNRFELTIRAESN